MSLKTNLVGRLRNTDLPRSNALLPLFEAVANSIHAIEDAKLSCDAGCVRVEIIRTPQTTLNLADERKKPGREAKDDVVGFIITDNGIGFDDSNLKSFETLDSQYKIDRGGRGVGRLLWLKAFEQVRIASRYVGENSKHRDRSIVFTASDGVVHSDRAASTQTELLTTVHLDGFAAMYRKASPKTVQAIASQLLEHCLWYFIRKGGAPRIVVTDDNDEVELSSLFDELMVAADSETAEIKGTSFDFTHVKLRAFNNRTHRALLCAAGRVVNTDPLRGKIPGLFGRIEDSEGLFTYECYVTSPFLDERVRSERTGFNISEKPLELFANTEISLNDIRSEIVARTGRYLSEHLAANKELGKERVTTFVAQKAPRYRPILARMPEAALYVDPELSDKELELQLHSHFSTLESKLLEDGHELMQPTVSDNEDSYKEKLADYLERVDDIKKSDLASYVSHRKVVIDLLEKAIQSDDSGKYAREDIIHQLIMPMRIESNELLPGGGNLWLLNERLAFHDYLASDKTLNSMPITGSTEGKEPDLCSLQISDSPFIVSEEGSAPFPALTIVEIKRPMRNDAKEGEDKDPIEQALGYLNRIRQGKVKTRTGRPIVGVESVPGYCYVICDLTATMVSRCRMHDLQKTSDGLGYFGYKRSFQAYVEVISFDQLVNAAKQRNRAFFHKLGLPAT